VAVPPIVPLEELLDLLGDVQAVHLDWKRRMGRGQVAVQASYSELVEGSKLIRHFETAVVPGLLQTSEYARCIAIEAAYPQHRRRPRPGRRRKAAAPTLPVRLDQAVRAPDGRARAAVASVPSDRHASPARPRPPRETPPDDSSSAQRTSCPNTDTRRHGDDVAHLLVDLAAEGTPSSTGVLLRNGLTQDDLAGMVGASRASVARALATLRELGFVSTGRRQVAVPDLAGLREFAD
jgi:hypothetical protein